MSVTLLRQTKLGETLAGEYPFTESARTASRCKGLGVYCIVDGEGDILEVVETVRMWQPSRPGARHRKGCPGATVTLYPREAEE